MGTGKKVRCKHCGAEWMMLQGAGFNNPEENREAIDEVMKCPECGSEEIEIDNNISMLWD